MKERLSRSGVAENRITEPGRQAARRICKALGDHRSISILAPVAGLAHLALEFEGGDYVVASTRCRAA